MSIFNINNNDLQEENTAISCDSLLFSYLHNRKYLMQTNNTQCNSTAYFFTSQTILAHIFIDSSDIYNDDHLLSK